MQLGFVHLHAPLFSFHYFLQSKSKTDDCFRCREMLIQNFQPRSLSSCVTIQIRENTNEYIKTVLRIPTRRSHTRSYMSRGSSCGHTTTIAYLSMYFCCIFCWIFLCFWPLKKTKIYKNIFWSALARRWEDENTWGPTARASFWRVLCWSL